jgi:hypothetical protein
VALSWLTLLGLPRLGLLPHGWHAHVTQRGKASILSQALAYLDEFGVMRRGVPTDSAHGSAPA